MDSGLREGWLETEPDKGPAVDSDLRIIIRKTEDIQVSRRLHLVRIPSPVLVPPSAVLAAHWSPASSCVPATRLQSTGNVSGNAPRNV